MVAFYYYLKDRRSMGQLKKELKLSIPNECIVCMDRKSSIIFECGHCILCARCCVRVKQCPLCRTTTQAYNLKFSGSCKGSNKLCLKCCKIVDESNHKNTHKTVMVYF